MANRDLEFVVGLVGDTKDLDAGLAKVAKRVDGITAQGMKGMDGSLKKQADAAKGGFDGSKITSMLGGMLGGSGGGGMLGQALGMAGSALGWSIGAMIGEVIGKVGPQAVAVPAKAITASLKGLGTGLRELGGALGPIGAGFEMLTGGINAVGDAIKSIPLVGDLLGPMVDALAMMPSLLKGITSTLVSFTAKASPGIFGTWTRALEDVQAVIGHSFLPVLELMRDSVRLFGDVLANILPSSTEVRTALIGLRGTFSEVSGVIRESLREIGPEMREMFVGMIKELSYAMKDLAPAIKPLIEIVTMLARLFGVYMTGMAAQLKIIMPVITAAIGAFATNMRLLLSVFGLSGTSGLIQKQDRSSGGAAARQASFQGFEEYQRQLQLSAFTEPGTQTMASLPTTVGTMSTTLSNVLTKLGDIYTKADAILNKIPNPFDPFGADAAAQRGAQLDTQIGEANRRQGLDTDEVRFGTLGRQPWQKD